MAKTKEDTQKKTVAGAVIPELAGLATQIGTAIPNLRREKRDTSASQAALISGGMMAGQIAGQGQQGFGASRALRGREAQRVAQEATTAAAGQAGRLALAEQQLFTARRERRNQRLADFGAGVADMGANIGQGVVEARAAKDAEAGAGQPQAMVPQYSAGAEAFAQNTSPAVGLQVPQAPGTQLQQPQGVQQGLQAPQAQQPGLGTPQLQVSPFESYAAAMGTPLHPALRMAPELEYKLRVTNLALEEATRRGIDPTIVVAQVLRQQNLNIEQMVGQGVSQLQQDLPGAMAPVMQSKTNAAGTQ